jgi:integrase
MRITKRSVEALRPKSIISDEEIKGFVARRPGSGAVTYGFRYRPKDGPARQRWLTLGRHGNITVEQARTLAKKRAGEVADARDPVAEDRAKQVEKEKAKLAVSNTVNAILDVFVESEEVPLPFRRVVRVLLLTAQRRNEVGLMRAEEIDGNTWTIPAERYKTGVPNVVPLTKEALRWIGGRDAGFLFSSNGGKRAFNGYSKAKGQLDKVIARQLRKTRLKAVPAWTLHDLRRTARSLMARAGVPSEVAEQVLGHKIPGVRGVYDRHSYAAEKREALEKLGTLIERMLNPSANDLPQTTPEFA